uniref:Uncharacterized protein n=1 Tax=Lepeophtheirus salmonis TaxID=72036 RepID=A0A0K2U081_LEPSM
MKIFLDNNESTVLMLYLIKNVTVVCSHFNEVKKQTCVAKAQRIISKKGKGHHIYLELKILSIY